MYLPPGESSVGTPETVAERLKRCPEMVAEILERMDKKDLIFRMSDNDSERYGACLTVV
jgi:hypothetical protein